MSSGLYNEGLFREGLLRTTNLVRPGLITQFDTLEEALTRFAVNGVEAALALDFIASEYRTANTSTTFADAFMGNSPKLTYSTAAGSNSTMVNSSGELVWAPHNLLDYSEDFSQWNSNAATLDVTLHEAPDGTQTARKLVASASASSSEHFLYRSNSEELGSQGKIAIFAKADEYDNLRIIELTGYRYYASFDLGSGNPPSRVSASGGANFVSASATPVGGGWFLCEIVTNRSTAGAFSVMGFPDGSAPTNAPANYTGDGTSGIYVWGAHVYRSDLGGMAQVPGADTGFEYYVPTNGNAEYLPRVGHHVYNGSTWVNEGLLIESEPRTNLVTDSSDFHAGAGWLKSNLSTAADQITSPSGQKDADELIEASGTITASIYQAVAAGTHTVSCYMKANSAGRYGKLRMSGNIAEAAFDLTNGTVAGTPYAPDNYGIEDVGNGWYLCWISATAGVGYNAITGLTDNTTGSNYTGDGTSSIYVWGMQVEEGSTPSSYMPTSGNQFTRTAQSLTVPPAEFGWPEPEYIGPELADGSQLDKRIGTDGTVSRAGGIISFTPAASGLSSAISEEITGLTVGKVYEFRGRARSLTSDTGVLQLRSGSGGGGSTLASASTGFTTSFADFSIIYKATDTYVHLSYVPSNRQDIEIVEASHSFREINPLSVSIQMDGRMTYADNANVGLIDWVVDGTNLIQVTLQDAVPRLRFRQAIAATFDDALQQPPDYSPGINVPFNISSRHGSTFVNGAVDGTALTANTTPTALIDLSNTDLEIAQDFMGTIGTFRQFAGDIGDAGLVTATNPSTEPTLSLTFDGSEGSFYNLNWSE